MWDHTFSHSKQSDTLAPRVLQQEVHLTPNAVRGVDVIVIPSANQLTFTQVHSQVSLGTNRMPLR